MNYQSINTSLQALSIVICFVLLLHQVIEGRISNRTNKWYSAMLLFNLTMLICNLCEWTWRGTPGKTAYFVEYVFAILIYFSCAGLLMFSLFGWIHSGISQKVKVSPVWGYVAGCFVIGQMILAFTTPITQFCYVSADNFYTRGEYFWMMQMLPYTIYCVATALLLMNVRLFKRSELVYLSIVVLIPIITCVIQIIDSNFRIINVSVTIALIIVFTFIQSEQELDHEQKLNSLMVDENKRLEEMQMFQQDFSSQLIEVLCSTVEAKDQYTRGHSLRVAQYAREIMYRLGGDEQAQQEVYYIGILHDVGKIRVKDEIINKKGRLTDEEYEQIKLHTVAGYQILRGVDVIPNLAIGARWHHERYDGKGYPNGLEGENIPLVARIISVADAYDAMTSNRSYHKTMPQSVVRDEIEKGMGTQFDPKIAQIMLDMIDEDMQYEMKQVNFNKAVDILVIDDDPITHQMVHNALIGENYGITSAYSGREALVALQEAKYDLCLLDMEMPDMTGFEVLEWIHKNVHRQRVIFLTGNKDMETILKSEQLGAKDYITKPVNPNVLRESVSSVLMH